MSYEEDLNEELLLALQSRDMGLMERLLDSGADVNSVYDSFHYGGSSILMMAALHNNNEAVEILVKRGANKSFKNKYGVSVYDLVRNKCREEDQEKLAIALDA